MHEVDSEREIRYVEAAARRMGDEYYSVIITSAVKFFHTFLEGDAARRATARPPRQALAREIIII